MENNQDLPSEILKRWYEKAAQLTNSVDHYLEFLRGRKGLSIIDQCAAFGVSEKMFLRLASMQMPRADSFVKDALKIAEACKLENPDAFVDALLLARNLHNQDIENSGDYYQAAFDARDSLDESNS